MLFQPLIVFELYTVAGNADSYVYTLTYLCVHRVSVSTQERKSVSAVTHSRAAAGPLHQHTSLYRSVFGCVLSKSKNEKKKIKQTVASEA